MEKCSSAFFYLWGDEGMQSRLGSAKLSSTQLSFARLSSTQLSDAQLSSAQISSALSREDREMQLCIFLSWDDDSMQSELSLSSLQSSKLSCFKLVI